MIQIGGMIDAWKIHFTVDKLNLKAVVVYDVCSDNENALKYFSYAIGKGINIFLHTHGVLYPASITTVSISECFSDLLLSIFILYHFRTLLQIQCS